MDQLTSSQEDSLANHSAWQENEEDLKTQEERFSLKLPEQPNKSNHNFWCLRTSKGYYLTTKERRLKLSSPHWMNSGTMRNGKCLTVKSGSHKTGSEYSLLDILEDEVDEKYFLSEEMTKKTNTNNEIIPLNDSKKTREILGFDSTNRFYDCTGICPCLNTMQGGQREPKVLVREATKKGYAEACVGDSINISHPDSKTRRGRVGKGVANTLLTGEEQTVVMKNYKIRKLTPLECWRLQTFPDELFYKAQAVNSNSQLYKQAGNSVTVDVVYEIAKRIQK